MFNDNAVSSSGCHGKSANKNRKFLVPYRIRHLSFISIVVLVSLVFSCLLTSSTALASRTTHTGRTRQENRNKDEQKQSSAGSKNKQQSKPSSEPGRSGKGSSKVKKDDLPVNYYDRLGVSKKATDKEIKKAYRKLAMKVSLSLLYTI